MNEEEKKDDVFNTSRFKKLYAEAVKDQEKKAIKPPSNTKYIIVLAIMTVLGIGSIPLIVWIRPDSDILVVGTLVFGFLTPTTTSLLAYMKSQDTHLAVNSRLDEFIQNAKSVSMEKGLRAGEQIGRDIANERTRTLVEEKYAREHSTSEPE